MKYLHTLICNMYFLHSCWSQSWVIIPKKFLILGEIHLLSKLFSGDLAYLSLFFLFWYSNFLSKNQPILYYKNNCRMNWNVKKHHLPTYYKKNLGNQACILKLMDVDEIIKCFLWENLQVDLRVKLLTKNK